jgi:hypothetical protein
MSKNQHRNEKFFLYRWIENMDGWLVEKEIQSAIIYQKEWKKKNGLNQHSHDDCECLV